MKLTKTRLKQIIREELKEEFKISRMGSVPKTQHKGRKFKRSNYDGQPIAGFTGNGWVTPNTQKLLTLAIIKEPEGKILNIFNDVPEEIWERIWRTEDQPKKEQELKKAMGLDRKGTRAADVKHADSYLEVVDYDTSPWTYEPMNDEFLKHLFAMEGEPELRKDDDRGSIRVRRIPTYEYIERFYPNMPQYDFNDFMTPQGPRGGKRQGKSVIGDLEDGE